MPQKQQGDKILIYSYQGNKNNMVAVGYTYTDSDTYFSKRRPEHIFRIFDGYAIGIDVYNKILNMNKTKVVLFYEDNIYESQLSQWKHTSHWDNVIKNTEQIDPQYVLELNKMKYYKGGIDNMENQDDLGNVGPIQSAGVDLAKYDKQVVTIEKSEIMQMTSHFTPLVTGTQIHMMQWVLRVSSNVLESIREGPDKIEFRATEVFNLTQNDQGKLIGFPTGEKSKLMKFLKDLKIANPEHFKTLKEIQDAIKGKQAVVKAETKERDGRTNTYLRFRY